MFKYAFWLTVIFAVLKIVGFIGWSWLVVFIPIIAFFVLWVIVFSLALYFELKT